MTLPISLYLWPGQTNFGFGAAGLAGQEALTLGAHQAFVLADPGVIAAKLLDPVIQSLEAAGLTFSLYEQVIPNPDIASVDAASAAYRRSGADIIVAVGGGSALDTAKGVRLQAGGPAEASIAEYALMLGDQARPAPSRRDLPPMIAIPTTAGTGAEVTPWAVITNHERRLKFGIGGAYLLPSVALIDPDLTLTLPPFLTAATGLDALSHCIEAYVSTNCNPVLDPMILYGIELAGRSLRVAMAQPANSQARSDMLLASMIGGIAISSKWLGACHSLAHQLSSFANVHHGAAIALMLPHQMAYSLTGSLERYAQVAAALDPSQAGHAVPKTAASREGSLRQQAERSVALVRELIADVGLPTRLRDVGISEELIPDLARNAMIDLNWWTNPRRVSEEVMETLYRAAY